MFIFYLNYSCFFFQPFTRQPANQFSTTVFDNNKTILNEYNHKVIVADIVYTYYVDIMHHHMDIDANEESRVGLCREVKELMKANYKDN